MKDSTLNMDNKTTKTAVRTEIHNNVDNADNIETENNIDNEICYLDELIIEGLTTDGVKFRPSDWVDRLCGMLAGFDERQKMSYSPYLRPMAYKNMPCVAVKKELQTCNPDVFKFIMQFANDNKLIVVDCASFKHQISQLESDTNTILES